MGLEIAEFLIALEDELNIRLGDSSPFEPETEVTVSMIVDYVEPKIREKETDEVMAADFPQKVFGQTAATLAEYAEVSANSIAPETLLTDLFADVKCWRKMWQVKDDTIREMSVVLSRLVKLELQYKKTQRILIWWGLSVMFLIPFILKLIGSNRIVSILGMIAYLLLSGYGVWRYCRSLLCKSERYPPQDITVGQFAEEITAVRRRFLSPDGSPLSRSAIETRVIEILADSMNMKPNDIMLTDRLVQDLKMG
jgi:acyl carrier protein